ncbi:MAG: GtrA family protein [Candidatus Binatia bacterium]
MNRAQPIRFVVVGAINTGAGLAAIYSAKYWFGLGDLPANALGYGLGFLVGFRLNALWTFAYRGSMLPALAKYTLSFAISYALNLTVVLALIDWADANAYLAQAAGVPPYFVCFFFLSRRFVFRNSAIASQHYLVPR